MGFFQKVNKVWSGLDFWDQKENQGQRQAFSTAEEEEERRRRAEEAARASVSQQPAQPGETVNPQQKPPGVLQLGDLQIGGPGPVFNPNQPLQKTQPQPQSEIEKLTASELPRAVEEESRRTSWLDRNLTDRDWKKRAEVTARNRAVRKYQEQRGYNQQPEVMEAMETNRRVLDEASDGSASKILAPLLSIGRVGTGIAQGAAGTYDLLTPGEGTNRLSKSTDAKAQEIDRLAKDLGIETPYKVGNVPTEIASYFIPATLGTKIASKFPKGTRLTEQVVSKAAGFVDDAGEANRVRRFLADRMRRGMTLEQAIEESLASAKYTGENAARGEDTTPGSLATDVLTGIGGSLLFPNRLRKAIQGDEVAEELAGGTLAATGEAIENRVPDIISNDLRRRADDLDVPAFERAGDKAEIERLEQEALDAEAQAAGVGPDALDEPAFKHKQDIEGAVDEGQAKMDEFINDNPGASIQDIEVARAAIDNDVLSKVELLRTARYGADSNINIPDPTSPRALAKADDAAPPMADFSQAINAPLEKAPVEPPTLPPEVRVTPAEVDAQGNPALIPDAQRARELAEEGVVPERGDSVVATTEEQMQSAANKTADEQVAETRVASYSDPTTKENIVLTPESLVDEITSLQSIPANRRTAEQTKKLGELLDIYRNWDERSVAGAAPNLEELFPDLTPEGRQAVQDTLDQLRTAQDSTKDLKNVRAEEKGARIARANEAYEKAGGGVEGMRAKTRALAGEYSKSGYEPIKVSDAAQKEVLDEINQSSNLRDWEKFNTQRAFEKMWGAVDEAPTSADIRNIQRYYNGKQTGLGDTIAEQLRNASKYAEDAKLIEQIAGAPRTMMTTFDFSSPRQAGVLMARHPIEGTKSFLNGVANFFKSGRFKEGVEEMANMTDESGANYSDFMQSVMDIHLPSVIEASEELMSSTPLLSKIPGYGRLVKASDRAFSGTLSELRFNVAKNWIDNAGGVDKVMQNFSEKELRDLGEALNTLSGRGGKAGGFVDKHASVLSKTLFSGRLWASRLNMLNPYWYYRLSGPARKEAMSSAAAFAALAGSVLYMAEKAGAEVETDTRSADFAKIKLGNTRYDILGGLQQNIRVASQVLSGSKINSATGEEQSVNPAQALGPFAEGKLSPLLGFAWRMANTSSSDDQNPLTREDEYGNEVNVGTEAAKLGVPMAVTGTIETAQQDGSSILNAAKKNVPGFFGAGVQTYGADAKVPTKTSDIEDAAKDGDYDKAISGYRALIEKENKRKDPSSGTIKELEGKIQKLERERDDTPDTEEAVNARVERGEFDAAISGYKQLLTDLKDKGSDASPEKEKEFNDNIKRLEVAKSGQFDAETVKLYKDTSVTEWRAMIDPDNDEYDPETAGMLLAYDQDLAEAGVSLGKLSDKTKFSEKKSGRGGRGKSANIVTNIGTVTPSGSYAPLKAQSASNSAPESAIPQLEKVANYSRKLKKIGVSRGRK